MKATELRLLNWVFDTMDKKEIQMDFEDFACCENFLKSNHPIPYKPIPLTEEWLLKFGFEHLGNGNFSGGFKNMFKISSHQFGIDFYYGGIDPYYIKPHYVHNLQNLYFALTNEELTLTK